MQRRRVLLTAAAVLATATLLKASAGAQNTPTENAAPTADNAVMITIFLKHDQSRPVSELMRSSKSRVTTRHSRHPASRW